MAQEVVLYAGGLPVSEDNPLQIAQSAEAEASAIKDETTSSAGLPPAELLVLILAQAEKQTQLLITICGLLTPAGESPIQSDDLR